MLSIDAANHYPLRDNHDFVSDCARYGEGVAIRRSGARESCIVLTTAPGENLGDNEALIEAIEAEKIRRVRDGSAARERANS